MDKQPPKHHDGIVLKSMVKDKEIDKLDKMMKRWQKETRDEIKKNGEKEFDFLNPSREGG